MEFIKLGKDKYLVKDSNGKVVNNKEKKELEKQGLIIKDFESNECQKETTKKIEEIDKELKEDEPIKKTIKSVERHNK